MQPEKIKRGVLVFFGLIVAVLIVEGALRFLGWGFLYLQERQNKESALSVGVQPDKAKDIQLKHAEKKELVILCIGESTTGLGGGNSWPSQLQRILNNMQDQRVFHVINKGVPGEHTGFMLSNLPGYLKAYKPDFVLAMAGINDSFPHVEQDPLSQPQSRSFLDQFRTYGLIEWIAGGIKARVTEKTEDVATANAVQEGSNGEQLPVYHLVNPNVTHLHPQTIRNLNDMVSLTTEHGINFVFVQYALRKVDILKNVIEGDAFYISSYDIFLELLKQYDYGDLFTDNFAVDFGHATRFGNRVIADNAARQLLTLLGSQEQGN